MMLMPPKIMIMAMNLNIIPRLVTRLMRNPGSTILRIILYIAIKTGRVAEIVETRDTGPLAIAQICSREARRANNSLKPSRDRVEFLRFMANNSLMTAGRIESIR